MSQRFMERTPASHSPRLDWIHGAFRESCTAMLLHVFLATIRGSQARTGGYFWMNVQANPRARHQSPRLDHIIQTGPGLVKLESAGAIDSHVFCGQGDMPVEPLALGTSLLKSLVM